MRAALYARVSTHDQQTLGMQVEAMSAYINDRGWELARQAKDVGSGTKDRPGRELLLQAARRREVDVVVVWRLDRWGRSVAGLIATLHELTGLGIGFVSLTEALDLRPSFRATRLLTSSANRPRPRPPSSPPTQRNPVVIGRDCTVFLRAEHGQDLRALGQTED